MGFRGAKNDGNRSIEMDGFFASGLKTVLKIAYIAFLISVICALVVGAVALVTSMSYADVLQAIFTTQPNFLAAFVGLIAVSVAVDTLNQKRRSDDRDSYFKSLQWATELTFSDDPRQVAFGWDLLSQYTRRPSMNAYDPVLLDAVNNFVARLEPQNEPDVDDIDADGTR